MAFRALPRELRVREKGIHVCFVVEGQVGFARSGPGFGPPGFFSWSEPEPEIFRALGFSGFGLSGLFRLSGLLGAKRWC